MPKRSVYDSMNRHSTLCWDCEKSFGRCSWSKDFVPVKNWKAKPTKILSAYGLVDSFDVYECPEFELRARLKKEGEQK